MEIRVSRVRKFQWVQCSLKDSNRPGRPVVVATKKNIDAMRRLVEEDSRYTISQTAHTIEGTVHHILNDRLKLKKVCAIFVNTRPKVQALTLRK